MFDFPSGRVRIGQSPQSAGNNAEAFLAAASSLDMHSRIRQGHFVDLPADGGAGP
jgi:hypothetical protein